MEVPDSIDFSALERELWAAVAADEKYQRENDAKFRAVHQKVGSYEEFRDIVLASHLRPLEQKDKVGEKKNPPWNSFASATHAGSQKDNSEEICQCIPGCSAWMELSGVPKTAAEFHRDWRRCLPGGAERYQFLLQLGPETLGRIFHADLAFGLLGELLTTLAENIQAEDRNTVVEILQRLGTTRRFSLNLDFLSSAEKERCQQLFQKLRDQGPTPVTAAGVDGDRDLEGKENLPISQETGQENQGVEEDLRALMALYKVT